MDVVQVSQFLIASVILTFSPGPDIIYVLTTSISKGFHTAFYLAFGLCSGLIIHTLLVGVGVSQIIVKSEILLWSMKIFAVFYLLYLAFRTYKSSDEIALEDIDSNDKSYFGYYVRGFIMNVINPKVSMFFLAFLPQFIDYENSNILGQSMFYGSLFFVQAFLIFSIVAFYASKISLAVQGRFMIQRILKYVQIIVFLLLSVSIMLF